MQSLLIVILLHKFFQLPSSNVCLKWLAYKGSGDGHLDSATNQGQVIAEGKSNKF